jgi:hypothetical protein
VTKTLGTILCAAGIIGTCILSALAVVDIGGLMFRMLNDDPWSAARVIGPFVAIAAILGGKALRSAAP